MPAESRGIGVGLEGVLEPSFLAVPDLGGPVFGRADEVWAMGVEVDALNWPIVPLIDLDDMLRPQIVELYLFIM